MFKIYYPKSKKALVEHSFFTDLDRFIEVRSDQLIVESKVKQKMIQEFTKMYLTVFKTNFKEYVETEGHYVTAQGLEKTINKCYKDYSNKAKAMAVPIIFLEKFDNETKLLLKETIEVFTKVCYSKLYETHTDKLLASLHVLENFIRTVLIILEKTVNSMNGELETALSGSVFDEG